MVRFPERNNRLIDKVRSVAIVRVLYRKSSHRIVTQTQRRSFLLRASPCLVFGRAHLSLPNAGSEGYERNSILFSIQLFVHPCARRPFHYRSEIAPDNRHIHLQSTSDKKTAISERKLLPGLKKPQIGIREFFIYLSILISSSQNRDKNHLMGEDPLHTLARENPLYRRPLGRESPLQVREKSNQERKM